MGYCVGNAGNLLWVIVWRVDVIFMDYCLVNVCNFYWFLCGVWQ